MIKPFRITLLFIILFEILSFLSYGIDNAGNIAFLAAVGLFLVITILNQRLAIYIALAELFIGGMGYLFSFDLNGAQISIRIAFFLILLAAWFKDVILHRDFTFIKSKFAIAYGALFFFLALALVNALARGNELSNIFFDFNAYLFFAYLPVFYRFIKDKKDWQNIYAIFLASFVWLCLKTLLVLYFFSHGIEWAIWPLYHWVRNTGIGEITLITSNVYRVFFQSHIYVLIGMAIFATILFLYRHKQTGLEKHLMFGAMILGAATVLISASRSFWAGALACLPLIAYFAYYRRIGILKFIKRSFIGVLAIGFGLLLLFSITKFPFPDPGDGSFGTLFRQRANISDEAAAASRWNLLPKLWQGIAESPIIGRGFGATITYVTNDPRIRAISPTGEYTTYAFEWGLLDLWYKLGLLGLLAYLYLLTKLIASGIKKYVQNKHQIVAISLVCGLIVLFVTNFFTPYLNHPLGIGYILLLTRYLDK